MDNSNLPKFILGINNGYANIPIKYTYLIPGHKANLYQ